MQTLNPFVLYIVGALSFFIGVWWSKRISQVKEAKRKELLPLAKQVLKDCINPIDREGSLILYTTENQITQGFLDKVIGPEDFDGVDSPSFSVFIERQNNRVQALRKLKRLRSFDGTEDMREFNDVRGFMMIDLANSTFGLEGIGSSEAEISELETRARTLVRNRLETESDKLIDDILNPDLALKKIEKIMGDFHKNSVDPSDSKVKLFKQIVEGITKMRKELLPEAPETKT